MLSIQHKHHYVCMCGNFYVVKVATWQWILKRQVGYIEKQLRKRPTHCACVNTHTSIIGHIWNVFDTHTRTHTQITCLTQCRMPYNVLLKQTICNDMIILLGCLTRIFRITESLFEYIAECMEKLRFTLDLPISVVVVVVTTAPLLAEVENPSAMNGASVEGYASFEHL